MSRWAAAPAAIRIARARAKRLARGAAPSPFRNLRHLEPVSRVFGLDRGLPVDRWYIERFLEQHTADIRGAVLEVGDDRYTKQFGSPASSDVLNLYPGTPGTTLVADLSRTADVPEAAFDCILCTQTLQFIHDVNAAVRSLRTMLKPGGVALCTISGISQISRYDMDRWGDQWRFTSLSAETAFARVFGNRHVNVETFGNVLTSIAFLEGIAAEELTAAELAHADPDYQLVVAVRARTPA